MNFDNVLLTKNNHQHKGTSTTSKYYSMVLKVDKTRYENNMVFINYNIKQQILENHFEMVR